jgi:ribosome-associated protein
LIKLIKPRTAKILAANIAKIAAEKLAHNILILDLTKIESAPADYFVICTANSTPQTKAIFDEIYYQIKSLDIPLPKTEGLDSMEWILLDYFDVVVHIMTETTRNYYKIEKLWSDAKFSTLDESGKLVNLNKEQIKQIFNAPSV